MGFGGSAPKPKAQPAPAPAPAPAPEKKKRTARGGFTGVGSVQQNNLGDGSRRGAYLGG